MGGYAYSGAGNGITRVDISVDGGQTWTQTQIHNENDPYTQRSFAWTLWNFELEIPEDIKEDKIEICIRAIDSNCNTERFCLHLFILILCLCDCFGVFSQNFHNKIFLQFLEFLYFQLHLPLVYIHLKQYALFTYPVFPSLYRFRKAF